MGDEFCSGKHEKRGDWKKISDSAGVSIEIDAFSAREKIGRVYREFCLKLIFLISPKICFGIRDIKPSKVVYS